MIERKLDEYGLQKVVPDPDVLADAYRAFHRSHLLREKFAELAEAFDAEAETVEVPDDLQEQVRTILEKHPELRWDYAIQIVLDDDGGALERVRDEKQKAKRKSGDFTSDFDDDEIAGAT